MKYANSLTAIVVGLAAACLNACGSEDGSANGTDGGTGGAQASSGGSDSGSSGTVSVTPTSSLVGQLVINELMPSNQTVILDEGGGSGDWLEIYNATGEDIDLGGFYLSDNPENPLKGMLASGLVVPAGGVLMLWADSDVEQGALHLPFNLSAAGEVALIADAEGNVIDFVEFGAATPDTSFARLPDGTGGFVWCTAATPNALNGDSC